jgi:hypothetical protein
MQICRGYNLSLVFGKESELDLKVVERERAEKAHVIEGPLILPHGINQLGNLFIPLGFC